MSGTDTASATATVRPHAAGQRRPNALAAAARGSGWELALVILLILSVAWASSLSPYYLIPDQITYSLQQSIAIIGLLAAGIMVIIVTGEIDISIPAIMAAANMALALFSQHDVSIWIAFPTVLVLCTLAGAINGALVVGFALPALAVTLGTMGIWRAVALWLGGGEGYAGFGPSYIWLGSATWAGYLVPVSLVLLVAVFACLAFVMHRTVFGRLVYLIGSNARAVYMSGARVRTVKIAAFAFGGAMAGVASLVYVGQYQSARADNASDLLLLIVTAVTLGGVDIFGGRGRVLGVLIALLLIGTLRNGMGLANFSGPLQSLVIGLLLVGSVLASQSAIKLGARLSARRRKKLDIKGETT